MHSITLASGVLDISLISILSHYTCNFIVQQPRYLKKVVKNRKNIHSTWQKFASGTLVGSVSFSHLSAKCSAFFVCQCSVIVFFDYVLLFKKVPKYDGLKC